MGGRDPSLGVLAAAVAAACTHLAGQLPSLAVLASGGAFTVAVSTAHTLID
ncbi:hypothetical protein [Streptomyces litchfieldiae]|uniref:Uncharacterized protein n=1 Tax=Streptomyces litchfieldiae TaxID=3075543 RepID=A0ABU2N1J6_9ACTN|nr:hypothetical protein [Streptomyces sp. DSM 44938]MDT0347781.1 hypothetical protein [Streptomyces sp. DSM 44938]